jgi:hypothetical protein
MMFVGIDPGATGGIAILDGQGRFVAAHRWKPKAPAILYQLLLTISGEICNGQVYLERIQAHPGEGLGHVVNNMTLVENYGLWQGFIIAAGLVPVLVHPTTWQVAHDLRNWQSKQKFNPRVLGPLDVARQKWPTAPLEFMADDGKAVALFLAALAHQDEARGLNRHILNQSREAKAKVLRQRARQKRRQEKKQGEIL